MNANNLKINKTNIIKIMFLLFSFAFVIPTILWYINNKTILGFDNFLAKNFESSVLPIPTGAYIGLYLCLFTALCILSIYIGNNNKEFFKTNKRMFLFISFVSFIFLFVLPFSSQDVFFYFGNARLLEHFEMNPYNITISEFVTQNPSALSDEIIHQGYNNFWKDFVYPYPPMWMLITSIFSSLSFGSIDMCLLLCKIACAILHILSSLLIYKIFDNRKLCLLFAINPGLLFINIADIHNDLFVIFFVLLSMYFLLRKNNILFSVINIAIAASIKYVAILALPFIIIYHFRDLSVSKRFLKCLKYGLLFLAIVVLSMVLVVKFDNMLSIFGNQQNYISNNFYILCLFLFGNGFFSILSKIIFVTFAIGYIAYCFYFLFKKDITEKLMMDSILVAFVFFTFGVITNFRIWYLLWIVPFAGKRFEFFNLLIMFGHFLVVLFLDNVLLFVVLFYLFILVLLLTKRLALDNIFKKFKKLKTIKKEGDF